MSRPWQVTPEKVEAAIRKIIELPDIKGDEVNNALQIAEQAISWAKGVLSEEKGENS